MIGAMKHSGDVEKFRSYLAENEERFRNMDEDTYDTLSLMVNQKDLQNYKEGCRNGEGGFDMCKAIQDIREEGRTEGMRTKEKVMAQNMFVRGMSIEDIAVICEEDTVQVAEWFDAWKAQNH